MSFALPPVKAKPSQPEDFGFSEGPFGVPDLMTYGLSGAKSHLEVLHPVQKSEQDFRPNQQRMNMALLRNTQGLHAPLRIAMELKAARKVGRLPFLQSSNVMLETLTGRDIEMDASDVFSSPELAETVGNPHAIMEHSFGIL